jgi:integrase
VKSLSVSVGSAIKQYVPRESVLAVIGWLPADNLEWKLLFAFGRFIGCRMPSEINDLTWNDVNWGDNTIQLKSPKTAYGGKPERLVPIFPEVALLLLSQSETVLTGTVYVFLTLRNHTNRRPLPPSWLLLPA